MQKKLPILLYIISAILVYPLITSILKLMHLLGERGARAYLILYVALPFIIITVIIFLLFLAAEIKQMRHSDD